MFTCKMAVIMGSFINFADANKSHSNGFFLTIKIVITNTRFNSINMNISGVKCIPTIMIMIEITINIIKSYSIAMELNEIKFLIITIVVITINIIKSCIITMKLSDLLLNYGI